MLYVRLVSDCQKFSESEMTCIVSTVLFLLEIQSISFCKQPSCLLLLRFKRICLQKKLTISCRNAKYTRYRVLGSFVEYMYTDVLDVNFRQQCHIVQRVKEDCAFVECYLAMSHSH